MTHDQACTLLAQIDRIRKQRGHGWEWRDPDVLDNGLGTALVTFNVTPERVIAWFRSATVDIRQMQFVGQGWWRVTFSLREIKR